MKRRLGGGRITGHTMKGRGMISLRRERGRIGWGRIGWGRRTVRVILWGNY